MVGYKVYTTTEPALIPATQENPTIQISADKSFNQKSIDAMVGVSEKIFACLSGNDTSKEVMETYLSKISYALTIGNIFTISELDQLSLFRLRKGKASDLCAVFNSLKSYGYKAETTR